jgi:hypothetical protein
LPSRALLFPSDFGIGGERRNNSTNCWPIGNRLQCLKRFTTSCRQIGEPLPQNVGVALVGTTAEQLASANPSVLPSCYAHFTPRVRGWHPLPTDLLRKSYFDRVPRKAMRDHGRISYIFVQRGVSACLGGGRLCAGDADGMKRPRHFRNKVSHPRLPAPPIRYPIHRPKSPCTGSARSRAALPNQARLHRTHDR